MNDSLSVGTTSVGGQRVAGDETNKVVRKFKADVLSGRSAPEVKELRPENFPNELKRVNRWLGWRWRWNDQRQKWDKPPVSARTGQLCNAISPDNWCPFDEALLAVESGRCHGLGFALGRSDGQHFAGVDLDDCRNVDTGELSTLARGIIAELDTYCEVSPTGTGVKLICVISAPPGKPTKNKDGTVEIYSDGRYFTLTGEVVSGSTSNVESRQSQLLAIHSKYIGGAIDGLKAAKRTPDSESRVDAAALAVMLEDHVPNSTESDGSGRLFAVACDAVEHDLSDIVAVQTILQYAKAYPFPIPWTDAEILQRVRDAEKRNDVARGSASRPKASKADPGIVASKLIAANVKDTLPIIRFWNESFWQWKNGRYVEIPNSEIRAKVVNDFEREWSFVKGEHISNVIEHLRAKTILPSDIVSPAWLTNSFEKFNPHECLATANQIIHLPSIERGAAECTIPATPALLITTACEFDLDLSAAKPASWFQFLDSIWHDDQKSIHTLQEVFGYLLTADTRQQKIFLLIGPKRSGKGTIARVLRQLVGEGNVAGPTFSGLATQFGLSELVGKSVAIISDARLSQRTEQSVVVERMLAISGEDKLTIDRKHRGAVHCQLPTRFVILSNELPRLSDASGTIVSRFVLLQTENSFYGKEDHGLTEKLTAELPGILVWAIEGWQRLTERGYFLQPDTSDDTLNEMTDLASPAIAFGRDRCIFGLDKTVAIPKLFDGWVEWCKTQNHEFGTTQTFGRNFRAAFPQVKISRSQRTEDGRTRYYSGVTLGA